MSEESGELSVTEEDSREDAGSGRQRKGPDRLGDAVSSIILKKVKIRHGLDKNIQNL